MELIDRELTAAKEAGVTAEQVQAITAEAKRRQFEPFDETGFFIPNGAGWICSLCGTAGAMDPSGKPVFSFDNRSFQKHRAWHNNIEYRLRRLERKQK